jgi:hypothetical protein
MARKRWGKWVEAKGKRSPEAYARKIKLLTEKYRNDPVHRAKVLARRNELYATRPENRAAKKNDWLKCKYGITLMQYQQMYAMQLGVCAICFRPESEDKMLAVDHDHESGVVRGLLCQQCNMGLGKFKDDPEVLANAIKYVLNARLR